MSAQASLSRFRRRPSLLTRGAAAAPAAAALEGGGNTNTALARLAVLPSVVQLLQPRCPLSRPP